MSHETSQLPTELYRGITLPASDLNYSHLTGPLTPGSRVELPDGRLTVADGNPYGVYMSTNANMVSVAYADPRYHRVMPGFEGVTYDMHRIPVTTPSVGIFYKINSIGLDIRQPRIVDYLKAVDNNGFEGREWVADIVPSQNVTAQRVKFDQDPFNLPKIIKVDPSQLEGVLEGVHLEAQKRDIKMRKLGNELLGLTPRERMNSRRVGLIIKSIAESKQ